MSQTTQLQLLYIEDIEARFGTTHSKVKMTVAEAHRQLDAERDKLSITYNDLHSSLKKLAK
jgi:hypothetical protein